MKLLVLIFSFFFLKSVSAQNDLPKCAGYFLQMDSIQKLGKDPFTVWSDCVVGKHIPNFSGKTNKGDEINTTALRGKIVVINFWFMTCEPCIEELPALNQLAKEYANKNVVLLGITYEKKARVDTIFLRKHQFDFTLMPDAQSIIDKFGESGYPTTFIVDKKGIIRAAWIGALDGDAKTAAYLKAKPIIDKLLAE